MKKESLLRSRALALATTIILHHLYASKVVALNVIPWNEDLAVGAISGG